MPIRVDLGLEPATRPRCEAKRSRKIAVKEPQDTHKKGGSIEPERPILVHVALTMGRLPTAGAGAPFLKGGAPP